MFSAHNVAIYIINWCLDHNVQITNLKLQKLLYFVQGEYSKTKGSRLIADDFYAWQLALLSPLFMLNTLFFLLQFYQYKSKVFLLAPETSK